MFIYAAEFCYYNKLTTTKILFAKIGKGLYFSLFLCALVTGYLQVCLSHGSWPHVGQGN